MERLWSTFRRVIRSERYSRFTLQPSEDGERHGEVNLSDDTEVEAGGSPSFRPAPAPNSRCSLLYLALGILVVFLFGCLVGLFSHPKPREAPLNCDLTMKNQTEETKVAAPEVQLNFETIAQILSKKLTRQIFQKTLSDFDLPSRLAGSAEDMHLANRVFDEFTKQEMNPWTDIHYVQLQSMDSRRPNVVEFGSDIFKPTGFLVYSPPGTVQGKLVYGNYGCKEDLDVVQKSNVELKGCVLLLRAGKISFAEQVKNAASKGASAVLIYPDFQEYSYKDTTVLYGHVHLGSGDPYTPGFPSFNHTQFPPTESSGLPKIPAQTITAAMASALFKKIGGPLPDASSGFIGGMKQVSYRLGGTQNITVQVNNVLVNKEIHNVFGVIKGFTDPDRYVVLGAQRDAWGQGYAKATVGTAVLIELAKAFHEMVEKDGFRPRRSLVFASFSAGEYGSVGATEWLEGYMSSLDKSVFTYINLDGLVLGRGSMRASASPLLYSLIESTMKEVKSPLGSGTVYDMVGRTNWEANVMRPMTLDDPAYPFLTFAGIPSVSFHFVSKNSEYYPYYGTSLDNMDHLMYQTNQRMEEMTVVAAQFAGQMALRLVHDHLLRLDVSRYNGVITKAVVPVYRLVRRLSNSGQLSVDPNWLNRARGAFRRAADDLSITIANTNVDDKEACRIINNKLMRVEHNLLSPYVSPVETPFRHLLLGRGTHTLASIAAATDMDELRTQLALATWTLQGCANAMEGDIWDIDDEI